MNPEYKEQQFVIRYLPFHDFDYTYKIVKTEKDALNIAKKVNKKDPVIEITMFRVEPVKLEKGWREVNTNWYNRKYLIVIKSKKLTKHHITNSLDDAMEKVEDFPDQEESVEVYKLIDEYVYTYIHD